jgi:hypothetical protein
VNAPAAQPMGIPRYLPHHGQGYAPGGRGSQLADGCSRAMRSPGFPPLPGAWREATGSVKCRVSGRFTSVTDHPVQSAAFCIVANIAGETGYGHGGQDVRSGLKHFSPGTRVLVLPPQWGDGAEQVIVVGYHRGTRGRGLARMVIPRRHLARFRVQAIYSPAMIHPVTRPLNELGWDHPPRLWPAGSRPSRSPRSGAPRNRDRSAYRFVAVQLAPDPAQERLVAAFVVLNGLRQLIPGQLAEIPEGLAELGLNTCISARSSRLASLASLASLCSMSGS